MGHYTEACRKLANYFGLPANIIFIDSPAACGEPYISTARSKMPAAFFVNAGKCDQDGIISISFGSIVDAINIALKHATEKAYVILNFANSKALDKNLQIEIYELITGMRELKLRPVIINFYPISFMNNTGLYYDELIIINHPKQSMLYYDEIIDNINAELSNDPNDDTSILEVNARLGNGPLVRSRPIMFSKPATQLIDAVAIGMLCYGVYNMYKKYKKSHKLKAG